MSPSIPNNRVDPTGTSAVRKKYAQKLRGAFADINTAIREGVREDDVFGLELDTLQDPPPKTFRFLSDDRQIDRFEEWLDGAIEDGPLEVIERDNNTYIRSGYSRAVQDADTALRAEGVEVPEEDLQDIFNQGVHRRTLQDLYTRNFENLENITSEMSKQIGEELSVGLAEGENPRKIARRITDRVDKIGKTRATQLARTEVINAYSQATLNRYEQFNIGTVTIQGEWLTAQDNRVCPICQALEGKTWTIEEARNDTISLGPGDVAANVPDGRSISSFTGEFPVRPPSHVNCRCRLTPSLQ